MNLGRLIAFVIFLGLQGISSISQVGFDRNIIWSNDVVNEGVAFDDQDNAYIISRANDVNQTHVSVLRKIDLNGNILWQQSIVGGAQSHEHWKTISVSSNNHVYIGEYGMQNFEMWCYDPSGNLVFNKVYHFMISSIGLNGYNFNMREAMESIDNRIYATGFGQDQGQAHLPSLSCFDQGGNILWARYLNTNIASTGQAVTRALDGNIFWAGELIGNNSFWVAKMDTNGSQIWIKRYYPQHSTQVGDIITTADSGLLISGRYNGGTSSTASADHITKIDKNGDVVWSKRINTEANFEQHEFEQWGNSIFLMSSSTNAPNLRHLIMYELDLNGNEKQVVSLSRTTDYPRDFDISSHGDLVIVGYLQGDSLNSISNTWMRYGTESTTDSNLNAHCFSEFVRHIEYPLGFNNTIPNWDIENLLSITTNDSLQDTNVVFDYRNSCSDPTPFSCTGTLFHSGGEQNLTGLFVLGKNGPNYSNQLLYTGKAFQINLRHLSTLGFSTVDNLIYALDEQSNYGYQSLQCYNRDGEFVYGSRVKGHFNFVKNLDVDKDGFATTVFRKNFQTKIYKIDTKQRPYQLVDSILLIDQYGNSPGLNLGDISYRRSTGELFGVEYNSSYGILSVYKLDEQNQQVELVATSTTLSGLSIAVQTSFFANDSILVFHSRAYAGNGGTIVTFNVNDSSFINYGSTPVYSEDGCSCVPPLVEFYLSSDSGCFGDTMTTEYILINNLDSNLSNLTLSHHLPQGLTIASGPSQLLGGTLIGSGIGDDTLRIEGIVLPPDTSYISIQIVDTFSNYSGTWSSKSKAHLLGLPFRDSLDSDDPITPGIYLDSSAYHLAAIYQRITATDTGICDGDSLSYEIWPYSLFLVDDSTHMVSASDSLFTFYHDEPFQFVIDYSESFCRIQDSISVDVFEHGFELPPDTLVCDTPQFLILTSGLYDQIIWSDSTFSDEFIADTTGRYSAMAIDSNGCANLDSIHVEFASSPLLPDLDDFQVCVGQELTIDFTDSSSLFSIGNLSDSNSITISDTGLIVVNGENICGVRLDTFLFSYLPEITWESIQDTTICEGDSIWVSIETNADSVIWFDDSIAHQRFVLDDRIYQFKLSNVCETHLDSFTVNYFKPISKIALDTLICDDRYTLSFEDSLKVYDVYGDELNGRVIYETSTIEAWYYDICDNPFYDTLLIELFPSKSPYFPNSFTPDYDGNNDVWEVYYTDPTKVHYQIYNRWGKLIIEGTGYEAWDGSLNGEPLPAGIYSLVIRYSSCFGQEFVEQHVIHLLR